MQQNRKSQQLVIGLIGLPARGKTHYSRKLMRYLAWLGYTSKVFNLSNYRRESFGTDITPSFYDQHNEIAVNCIQQCTNHALHDMVFFLDNGGDAAIYDATNTTKQKRSEVLALVKSLNKDIIFFWIECICNDEQLIQELIKIQHNNPDFITLQNDVIKNDILKIQSQFQQGYETIEKDEGVPFIKFFDLGAHYEIFGITGYLPCKCLCFLMNLNVLENPIYLSRHGESLYNIEERIGGDSDLSHKGQDYASMLEGFFTEELQHEQKPKIQVFTSTLKRAIVTAEGIKLPIMELKILDEISSGTCDGMTYKEIEDQLPFEHQERDINKLTYRYPRGESYLDLITRLEPIIFEIERSHHPVIIVAHQAILRCLYAYLKSIPIMNAPFISIPQHAVMKFVSGTYVCKEDRFNFDLVQRKIQKIEISNDDVVYAAKFSEL